jgi:hypothetical protein
VLLCAYPKNAQSTVFGPSFLLFNSGKLTFAKQPHVLRKMTFDFLPFHP